MAVVILHVYKTLNWLLIDLSRKGYIRNVVATWNLGNHLSISVHVCPLIFRGLSPDSVITNQHIFLSFTFSFLQVAGCWLSWSCRYFLPPSESDNIRTHSQKCLIFMTESLETVEIPNRILRDTETAI